MSKEVIVIGAGLAGVEASYLLANLGVKVKLYEMRPKKSSPAHQTELFAELVCSNSLRSNSEENAAGILKREMKAFNSLVMESALENIIESGNNLSVDRVGFSKYITDKITSHPLIEVIHEEVVEPDFSKPTIIATGPLTSDALSLRIKEILGSEDYFFFDAAAPIIDKSSINMQKAYFKSRYDKGEALYLNCPLSKEEYEVFYQALISAEIKELRDFEKNVFEGCMPVEVMAKRGLDTLRYGPLKPVGLTMPCGNKPYAVVQLRPDDAQKNLYNMVGFQTNLKFSEQLKVFRLIPGLENMKIARYGVMHKNTYINSPKILNRYFQVNKSPKVFFAGQITGVEGYVESSASGLAASLNMYRYLEGKELIDFSRQTMIGALANYISNPTISNFQPMNINLSIVDDLSGSYHKSIKRKLICERALLKIQEILKDTGLSYFK
ncbi:MAG: methylenetetrahydrofolate--tRNA-(uracil(54)-C(5))-methyltransferase (FADH(2)-oxidizing) TrmFO [Erysipelotrichales bacterium]|nr:methylenetetrahydrofolate--tRNA-(uracil(54)-C(5))-methyltransferase (FADH(2)-oxidizing) TrmFO [Erysipelotrichales bacterium]